MVKDLVPGILCMLAAVASQAATSAGQIGVHIALTGAGPGPAAAVSCTSRTGAAIGSVPVQVTCTSNVYVNITQVSQTRESTPSVTGQFITGFGLVRSSGFSERVAGQVDEPVAQDDQVWSFEGRIYAGNAPPGQAERLAKWRLWNSEGTLTALGVAADDGQPGAVEMLVSF